MKKLSIGILMMFGVLACTNQNKKENVEVEPLAFTQKEAEKIIELPLHCIEIEYPNKLGQVLGQDSDLKSPKTLRPIFYGCFDWHSSVHGFWSIVTLMQKFPDIDKDNAIRARLNTLITEENCKQELAFFEDKNNRNFERTYGWAWFFQLHGSLKQWNDADAQRWTKILDPLATTLVDRYEEYLPKLMYPIRTGTHDNTAFSLSLSLDYAREMKLENFETLIVQTAKRLYLNDEKCNLAFEPSGHDFLSPCLEEARLMSKVLPDTEYKQWLKNFLPQLFDADFKLNVALVSDRTDGHLVHLDGLNFSRANCLNALANKVPELSHLKPSAKEHFDFAFGSISGDDYMGSHWLGTFALYTLLNQ